MFARIPLLGTLPGPFSALSAAGLLLFAGEESAHSFPGGFLTEGPGSPAFLELALLAALPVVLGVLSAFLLLRILKPAGRRGFRGGDPEEGKKGVFPALPFGSPEIPSGVFPAEWKLVCDRKGVSDFFDAVKKGALEKFREAVHPGRGEGGGEGDPPKAPSLDRAAAAAGRHLLDSLGRDDFFRVLGEESLDAREKALFREHLGALLPPFQAPPPPLPATGVRVATVACAAALGAFCGNLSGGAIMEFFHHPRSVGALFGSVLGAFVPALLTVYLAQHKRVRLALMGILGTAAAADIALGVLAVAGPAAILGRGKSSRLKRLGLYLAAFLVLLLAKGKEGFDGGSYERSLSRSVDEYLELAFPLTLLLLYRLKRGRVPETGDEGDLLAGVVAVVKKMLAREGSGDDFLLAELERKLSLAGFETGGGAPGEEELSWEPGLREKYETFGYVKTGDKVSVEEEPVVKDGVVMKKGQVVPR
ncbi:MAG: hypothetical protein LBR53_04460 [Deltaproteobacteria bacterium]|jgi:hypothetical protein|nr:hypothetical protein [Deltaproteobacteria bacterium]